MAVLDGKRALVTGGTTGLGLAIAGRFLREGARVVITGRDRALGERAGQALGPGARFIAADAADPAAVASSVSIAADHLGGLDVLVNNAGIYVSHQIAEVSYQQWQAAWRDILGVNLTGAANATWCAVQHMIAGYLAGPDGDAIRAQSPFGRVARPDEIAAGVAFLASPEAEWASGAILDLNGASYLRT